MPNYKKKYTCYCLESPLFLRKNLAVYWEIIVFCALNRKQPINQPSTLNEKFSVIQSVNHPLRGK